MNATPASPGEGDQSQRAMSTTMTSEVPAPLQRLQAPVNPRGKRLAVLTLTALGVVFGDIGTSPLYAIKDAFKSSYGLEATASNVFGLLSLIVWALVLIVSVKYVGFILRADNRGEGGVYALLALIIGSVRKAGRHTPARGALILLGLFGGAFLYGDGLLRPLFPSSVQRKV
jgi:KUP system potassium uptake protein